MARAVPVGHPGLSVTIYDQERWQEQLAHDLCAEEGCLDWGVPVVEDGKEVSVTRIRGRAWYKNGYSDSTFPEHLRSYCFTCAFWHEVLEGFDQGTVVTERPVVDPVTLELTGETEVQVHQFDWEEPIKTGPRALLGYGGHRFVIEFTDGRCGGRRAETIWQTNNLWHRGRVPEWFRHRFIVNARFLESAST